MADEPDQAPTEADASVEAVMAIGTDLVLKSIERGDDKTDSLSAQEGNCSTRGVVQSEPIPGSEANSLPNSSADRRFVVDAPYIQDVQEWARNRQSRANAHGDQAEKPASEPTTSSGEATSSNDKRFELGENVAQEGDSSTRGVVQSEPIPGSEANSLPNSSADRRFVIDTPYIQDVQELARNRQSRPNAHGDQAEKPASEPTTNSGETTSSNDKRFELGENVAQEGDSSTRGVVQSEPIPGFEGRSLPNSSPDNSFVVDVLFTEGVQEGAESGQSRANAHGDQAEKSASEPTTNSGETTSSDDKRFELGENVVVLRTETSAPSAECLVYVIGTAHVSQESCDEVQAAITHLKPQVVFLELCKSRIGILTRQKLQVPTFKEMVDMYRKKGINPFGIMYSWFLAKMADKLKVFPGSEFRVAYESARAIGARTVLGDRPVQVTVTRTWARMSTWHKTKLFFAMIFQSFFLPSAEELSQLVEDMKDTDMISALIQEMSKSFPSLLDTVVHERDLYMTAVLRVVARESSSVVAVVGKGHLQGISKNWEKEIFTEELMTVPKKEPSWSSRSVVRWGTVAVAVGGLAVVVGVYYKRKS